MSAEIQTEINKTETGEERIQRLLEQNLEYNKAIYELAKKTKKYMLIMQIMSWVRVLLIAVPLTLALIYLPPLLKNYLGQYQELLGGDSVLDQLKNLQGAGDLQDLLK